MLRTSNVAARDDADEDAQRPGKLVLTQPSKRKLLKDQEIFSPVKISELLPICQDEQRITMLEDERSRFSDGWFVRDFGLPGRWPYRCDGSLLP